MGYRYAILGAGRQSTAAAYDLMRFGEASQVVLADADLGTTSTWCEPNWPSTTGRWRPA